MEINKIETRPFAWHDLLTFYRYRHQALPLESAMRLTRGSSIGIASMMDYLDPTRGSYTAVTNGNHEDRPLLGQMHFTLGERSAHLSFLMPGNEVNTGTLLALLDGMAVQAAEMGAFSLLAELDENSDYFQIMRRAGYQVYARQQNWQIPVTDEVDPVCASCWHVKKPEDEATIRSLYHSLVPPLVQGAEAFSNHYLQGMVFKQNNELLAFVEETSGPHGIYLNPLIHPSIDNIVELLKSLPAQYTPLLRRPVYIAVRSYQGWLSSHLERLKATPLPQQALLVKYFVLGQRSAIQNTHHRSVIEAKTKPAAPIVHQISKD